MYTGHLAVALAAARTRRRVPMLVLVLASQAPDWIQLLLAPLGDVERAQLWSHSIPAVLAGALSAAVVYAGATKDPRGAGLLALVYLSHPILDLVTGSKPLWPGGPAMGACLYNHPSLDWLAECAVVLAGWFVYQRAFSSRRQRRLAVCLLAALLVCQSGVDLWQSFRILRAPDVGSCRETST